MHADLARRAKKEKLDAWAQLMVCPPVKMGPRQEDVADTRWVPSRREAEGAKTVEARLVAKGYQEADLRNGDVDISGCVGRRSPRRQLFPLGLLKQWAIWSLDIKNARLQADGIYRAAYGRAPREWDSKDGRRVWNLRAPAYCLNAALVASHRPLRKYLSNSVESPSSAGIRSGASSFGSRPCYVSRESGGAAGAITTHIDGILGCGEPVLLRKTRRFLEKRSVYVGAERAQEKDSSAALTPEDPTMKLNPSPPLRRCGQVGITPCRWTRPKCGSASLAGCAGLPRSLDQISARVWHGLPQGPMRSV